jgi:hypothetical protein
MENPQLINIVGVKLPPDEEEKYLRWLYEVYFPLTIDKQVINRVDLYATSREKADYPPRLSLYHYINTEGLLAHYSNTHMLNILKDIQTTFHREYVWAGVYQLLRSFRSIEPYPHENQTTIVDDVPVVHFLGFRLSAEKEEFNSWFNEWGAKVYVPILMKLKGLKAANFYVFTGRSSRPEMKDPGYPDFLSLWYFDTFQSYWNFEESRELTALMKALKSDFLGGISLKWNIQYELYKTFKR